MRFQTLDEIGARYRTEKIKHEYLEFYDSLFYVFRFRPIRLLEIGFFKGASAKLFAEYFPAGMIHVLDHYNEDIEKHWERFPEDLRKRIILHKGDQGNSVDIQFVLDEIAKSPKNSFRVAVRKRQFHVIIDDGSHRPDHQITSFEELWPVVTLGGYYIIEDLNVAYKVTGEDWKHETVNYFFDKVHYVNKNFERDKRGAIDIESISFPCNLIVIKKKEEDVKV